MGVDRELLELLICPSCQGELELVSLPQDLCAMLVERYREKFRDEEPVVQEGLKCQGCGLTYPVVSDIPVMLVDEALPAQRQ
ncbi:MAG: hypothetical protein NZ869_09545 [Thermoanaerobaculum sp.]|nr:hypothetical protein [Thermoanaerobaculum sp.]MDW7966602.1 Trm112 family protein [Thermoanaerobaculum sp.]